MDRDDVVSSALAALTGEGERYARALEIVPSEAGLYAFHAEPDAWAELGLVYASPHQPLYVGKAERSLHGRDVRTHFATGRTGTSTLRRSLAALLVGRLNLVAVPRNPARRDGRASFGLEEDGDRRLTEWMVARLRLATWISRGESRLADVESAVLQHLRPPLNVVKVGEPRTELKAARRAMSEAARAWRPPVCAGPYDG